MKNYDTNKKARTNGMIRNPGIQDEPNDGYQGTQASRNKGNNE
jgi:hypothetical protein